MNRNNVVNRICKNAILLALMCIVGMFSIPLGANVKVSLQLLMVFLICLISSTFVDCLIITSLYLLLGLFLPFYAGFNMGISPTFGFVISFVVISPIVFFLNKIPRMHPPSRMFIACFVGLIVCYLIGSLFMMLYLKLDFVATLSMSVIPYIPFDIAKIIIAVLVVLLLPEKAKNTVVKLS